MERGGGESEVAAEVRRTILAIDDRQRSMTSAGDVPQGHEARLMHTKGVGLLNSAGKAIDRAAQGIADTAPRLVISVSCVGRRRMLDERTEEQVESLPDRVSRCYADADQDRYQLERSQELASREMGELHAQLAASQSRLASLLPLSSHGIWKQDSALRFSSVSAHTDEVGQGLAALLRGKHALLDLDALNETEARQFEAKVAARMDGPGAETRAARACRRSAPAPTLALCG